MNTNTSTDKPDQNERGMPSAGSLSSRMPIFARIANQLNIKQP
jgi:hypothetical protein